MADKSGLYALIFLGVVALGLFGYLFRKPLKLFLKLCKNTVFGGLLLILFNTFGFPMGVNVFTALTVGLLGIPGIIGLYVLKCIIS